MIQANRNSLFVGGRLGLGGVPLQGGAGGPARLFVNLSLADTIFNPLIEKQCVGYSQQDESVVTNETLLNVSLVYFDLVAAYGRLANASVSLESARKLLFLTEDFESEGAGSKPEVQRAAAEFGAIKQQVAETATEAAQESYTMNRQRIQAGEGLPIEMRQAIRARWNALDSYTQAVTKYNLSQFQLIRAVGRVPAT